MYLISENVRLFFGLGGLDKPNGKRLLSAQTWHRKSPRLQAINLALLVVVAVCFSPPAEAKRGHAVSRPPSLDVPSSPETDARVADEVAKAQKILEQLNTDNLLASPYLVSAIYYHDGFLRDFPVDRSSSDPERRIIGQIAKLLSPERKVRFVQLLHEVWERSGRAGPERSSEPVTFSKISGGRRSHRDAVDLFAPEGAAVHAVSRGLVILADHDWTLSNLFSSTSRKGGNAVIVFDPDHDLFYRYCHLGTVQVSSGNIVAAGQILGTVGHTGLNASRPGHGCHLHLEANQYAAGHVRAMDYRRLRNMLRQWHNRA
jgi:murein DD-endopeptidase MepM/ murein hydrolase activator NlpD